MLYRSLNKTVITVTNTTLCMLIELFNILKISSLYVFVFVSFLWIKKKTHNAFFIRSVGKYNEIYVEKCSMKKCKISL